MSAGWYKRRRGILEHIESGTIDLLESGIHDYLSLKANLLIGSPCSIPVGVVFTSAPAIHIHCRRVSERTIQRRLEHLEKIGWIKSRPWQIDGKHGNYPVLVCRASVHDLSGNEYRINGEKTIDWRHPVYEPVGELSPEVLPGVGKLSGYREGRTEIENGEKPKSKAIAAKTAPLTPLFHPFFDIWNLNRGKLPEAKTLTKSRLDKCRARAREISEDVFRQAVCRAASAPFLLGLNDRGWKASFDWFIANDKNCAKVIEGNYDGQPQEPLWKQKQKEEEGKKVEAVNRFEDGN
jgi:hypothetical protein